MYPVAQRRIPGVLSYLLTAWLLLGSYQILSAQTAPTVASLSHSQTVNEGDNVALSVSVNGTTPFTYQWKKNGSAISGATSSTLTLNSVRVADEGLYAVTINNAAGSITSGDVMIAVRPAVAPQFYYQPNNVGAIAGDTIYLSASVSGTSPMTFTWTCNGTTVATTTSSGYSKTNFQAADTGTYTVTATNIAGSVTSNNFNVSLVTPTAPSFYSQPQDVTVDYGSTLSLYVSVSGSSPISFTWKRDGATITTTDYSSYYKSTVDASDAGSYTVTATNSAGAVISNAFRVTVRPAFAPQIQSITNSLSVNAGDSFSLSVNATGTPPLSFQWKKDNVVIASATSSYFYRSPAQAADAGTYTVVVSNAQGTVTSQGVAVSVSAPQPPLITSHPQSRALALQDYLSLSVGVSGTQPFTYQWMKDGVIIVGATSYYWSNYMTAATTGSYTVSVSNAQGSVTSEPAVITLLPAQAPVILQQPASQNLVAGNSFSLSVSVRAQPAATYQWSKDGVVISGATSSYYSKSNIASSDAGNYSVVVTNSAGTATSTNAVVTISPPSAPRIIQDPASASLLPGDYTCLSVSVSDANLTYQWQKNGVAIPSATYSNYTISSAQPSDAGSYTVVVANSAGTATSRAAVITVDTISTRPVIIYTSGSMLVTGGSWVNINVNLSVGTATLRWLKDGVAIPGATSTSFSVQNFSTIAAGTYTAEVTTTSGTVTSRAIVLQQLDAGQVPQITMQPVSVAIDLGQYFNLSVSAQGENPLSYQWQKNGTAIPGATNSSYGFQVSNASDAGAYSVVITNRNGSVTSSAAMLAITTGTAPVITAQPVSQTVRAGDSIYLSIGLQNSSGVTYQWKKDGTAISGATYSNYSFTASTSLAGRYTVAVTNSAGTTTSLAANVAIAATVSGPSFTAQPVSQSVFVGQPASLTVAATSTTGTVTYQWRENGVDLPGQTATTLAWTAAQTTDAGTYTVVATDSNGASLSTPATLSVLTGTLPVFTRTPVATTAVVGQSVTLSGAATGSPTPTYQWRKDGFAIAGATSSTLVFNSIQSTDAGTYSLVATNTIGSAVTAGVMLTVFTQPPVAPQIIGYTASNLIATIPTVTGTEVVIIITASGYPAPVYQWRKDGINISGATSAILRFPSVQITDSGKYTVLVSNSVGSVVSPEFNLTVTASFMPTVTPPTQTVSAGQTASFTANPGAIGNIGFQWLKNGVPITGGTGNLLTLTNVQPGDAGGYSVRATLLGPNTSVVTAASTLIVQAADGSAYAGIYTGSFGSAGYWALLVKPDGTGTFLGILTGRGLAILAQGVKVNGDGTFHFGDSGTVAADGTSPLAAYYYGGPVDGRIGSAGVTGQLTQLGLTLVNQSFHTGTEDPYRGFYAAVATNGSTSDVYTMASTTLGVLFVTVDATGARGGRTSLVSNGSITYTDASANKYTVQLNATSGTLSGTCQPVNGSVVTILPPATPSGLERLASLSTRGVAGSADSTMIAGFIISGTEPKEVMIRAVGPGLTSFGVPGVLSNPRVRLFQGSTAIMENDDWSLGGFGHQIADTAARLYAFPLPAGSADAALIAQLNPGVYTAQVTTDNSATGVALIEVYDTTAASSGSKLIGVSTRGSVGRGDDALIVGLVISGNAAKRVLIRGVGAALGDFGVSGTLSDPILQLYNKDGVVIATNDNWSSGTDAAAIAAAASQVQAYPLVQGSRDAALLLYLAPGSYTAIVRGVGDTTGIALVEAYEVP
jgi:hypothetical protein